MNQNRNNNRRRGRGNNNRGGQGGGGNQNRIDSRARGNAPQMLEKYRKLAHDASLNGDRVQTEYYLQFADHYFRVVADSRTQRDDQRPREPGEREPSSQGYEYEEEDDMAEMGRPNAYQPRRDRDDDSRARQPQEEGEPAVEGEPAEVASEDANPFVRDNRERRPRQRNRNGAAQNGAASQSEDSNGFDPGVLPPSIAREAETEAEQPAAPRPRTRTRRPRRDDEGDEALEAVG